MATYTTVIKIMGKLIGISRSKYRVAISDILPYERPVFFTNRFFVRFLKHYGVICSNGRLVATKNQREGIDEMLAVLGGVGLIRRPAFQYSIAKSCTERGRRLTIIHPYHQVAMVEFYDKYKMVISDFCQRSRYSIRFPHKVAVVQKKPMGFPKYISEVEQENHPEESNKHFFVYNYYNNINDFYDDYRFLQAEKKFSYMEKTDLEHCFDSIIPIMLSQAMFGCDMENAKGTMPYDFYNLNLEYENRPENGNPGEGIIIGPEFSRIYAEIILQQIDAECETILERSGVLLNRDYIFYRYVDDGFLFFSKEKVRNLFNETYINLLSKYGLKRGEDNNKHQEFDKKPFLESIAAGKLALAELIDSKIENRLETFKGFKHIQTGTFDTPTKLDYKSFVQSVRVIMKAHDLNYKDVMSFILGKMNRKVLSLLSDFNNLYKQYCQADYIDEISEQGLKIKKQYEEGFLEFLCNLTEVLYFFFCSDPRMNTSIKVVGMINELQLFLRGKFKFSNGDWSAKFTHHYINEFDEKITDLTQNLFSIMAKDSICHIEVLNFLELQKCMSKAVQIHPRRLTTYVETLGEDKNFFTVFQLLHYIKNDLRYEKIKNSLVSWIQTKISCLCQEREVSDTEAVLTFLEVLCCPWVKTEIKKNMINEFNQFDDNSKNALLSFASCQKDLFVKWRNYNIFEEMQHIKNTEVY